MRSPWILALATLFCASHASASTLPRVDFKPNETIYAVGLFDANWDRVFDENWSAGLSLVYLPGSTLLPWIPAARTTYRYGEWNDLTYGATLGAGFAPPVYAVGNAPYFGVWLQPALDVTWRPDMWSRRLAVRATLGPMFSYYNPSGDANGSYAFPNFTLMPNIEAAWRYDAHDEFTVGGNALVGWRGIF